MQVLTKSKCQHCDGAGVVAHEVWKEFFEVESKSDRAWEQREVEDWFRRRGYSKLPPEEPTCFECEGSGEIEQWIDLQRLLEIANIIG